MLQAFVPIITVVKNDALRPMIDNIVKTCLNLRS